MDKLLLEFVESNSAKSNGTQGVQVKVQVIIIRLEGRELGKIAGNYKKSNHNRKACGDQLC